MNQTLDPECEHIKLRLIAAAVGLQQCMKTAANVIPIPGTERVVVIGTPVEVPRMVPDLARVRSKQLNVVLTLSRPTSRGIRTT